MTRPAVAVAVVVPVSVPLDEVTVIRETLSLAARFPKRSRSSITGSIASAAPVRAPTGSVTMAIEAAAAARTVIALLVTEFSEPLVKSNWTWSPGVATRFKPVKVATPDEAEAVIWFTVIKSRSES